ncbi:enoyl-CoA hydratase-related protein [Sphingobium sp. YR768]|uniref:enoyl-CoA hydratase-related protein n=1 Tax=Sphingobium sp. YR768 TaxID=1884365 RepID=UPI0008BBB528|nr:enoyl-CoA hydratase-related protein [Sphingobium sp. YR768]SES12846.1 1,4-Dihydroxy-2-naphthoyl-CoA synthase [Sphingobium sp. YR768]
MEYQDILYEVRGPAVWITINRPEKYNAFRGQTCEELIHAFNRAGYDKSVAVVVLTGAGDKAFCTGGDQSAHDGGYDGRGIIGLPVEDLQSVIRDIPKPVIARVQGFAIGGGNVLVTVCDLAIASTKAVLGQVGPKVGSVDPGFGTALLSRVVGEKKAREIWMLCRRYPAAEALQMGLVNAVVEPDQLDAEVEKWCMEIAALSPTAISIAKKSFNLDSESIRGISAMGMQALSLFYDTEESKEGVQAFLEKRTPKFR